MKALLKACSIAALVTFSTAAYAENAAKKSETTPPPQSRMNCMTMGDMQKNMGSMMKDMIAIISTTTDLALKAKMQEMHAQMSTMMGGGMTGSSSSKAEQPETAPAPAPPLSSQDHKSHHPQQ